MESYKDYSAKENLALSGNAKHFNDWMFEIIKPYIDGYIFEGGSGLGTISKRLVNSFPQNKILLSDIDPFYINLLKKTFQKNSNVEVKKVDLSHGSDFKGLSPVFDTFIMLNVLEHIKNDSETLKCVFSILKPGGRCIILVPAHPYLFNSLDTIAGHYRRYTHRGLAETVGKTDFKIDNIFYFNTFSILGWFINGTVMRRADLSQGAMALFDFFVPLLKLIEKYIIRGRIGISLVTILKKPNI